MVILLYRCKASVSEHYLLRERRGSISDSRAVSALRPILRRSSSSCDVRTRCRLAGSSYCTLHYIHYTSPYCCWLSATPPSNATTSTSLDLSTLRRHQHGRRRRLAWRCRLLLQRRVWPQHPWLAAPDHPVHHCRRRRCQQTVLRHPLREHHPRMYVDWNTLGMLLGSRATAMLPARKDNC